ncbi:MAG: hypothetical protein Q8N47_27790 [Bryobacterales bacterium]|nr:hypothetical protein [Bryobacterales bacterium]
MKKLFVLAIGALIWVGSASAQPVIRADNGVLNTSSYLPDIARGSWFVVLGAGMGPATISVYSGGLPYPTEQSGTRVTFTPAAGGTAVEARLWYTRADQLAALLPSATAAGSYDVRVIYNGQTSAPRRVTVVERNFGFATQAENGAGPAQATYGGLDLNRFTTGTLGQWAVRPAKAGDTLVLWGTGLGQDLSSDLTGGSSGDQGAAGQVRVVVGGTEIAPLYAGRASGYPGLDQINFTLPAGVATGCTVSLQVRAGGRTSNAGSLAIASAGQSACTHPSLTLAQLTKLDQPGGTLTYGDFTLSGVSVKMSIPGFGSIDTRSETVGGSFGRYSVDQIANASFSVTTSGECLVTRLRGGLTDLTVGASPAGLDAGSALSLTLPGGRVVSVPKDSKTNTYSASLSGTPNPLAPAPPAVIVAGMYGLAGPGGIDVRSFTASINAPGGFVWSNQDAIAEVDRSRSLPIAWSGAPNGSVSIMGFAGQKAGGTDQDPIYDVAMFVCQAPASVGQYTVATSVLQQLPAAAFDLTGSGIGMLIVMAEPDANTGKFDAQLVAGGAVDGARFSYGIGSAKTLSYK